MDLPSGSFSPPSGRLRLPAADLDPRDGQREHEPENAHHPGVVPRIVRQPRHHDAAQGRRGGAGQRPGGGVAAVAHGPGRVLDVQQHGPQKGDDPQRARLDPDLQIDVVGVDEGSPGVIEVVVLDELASAYEYNQVDRAKTGYLLENHEGVEIVITGRNPDEALIRHADYITEMKKIKHPFDLGISAREGIEY